MRLLQITLICLLMSASAFARPGDLIWHDEFDGSSLTSQWTNGKFWWNGDGYNDADHVYRTANTVVANGALSLTLKKQSATSWQGDAVQYTSGLVQTGGIQGSNSSKFTFQYGYAEARIKMPKGQGVWPAFWMLPASYHDTNGEIDVMEYIGSAPKEINSFVHTHGQSSGGAWASPVDMSTDWHTYGVDWQKDYLKFYVDGMLRRTINNATMIPKEPEYLILNLQTGGDWAGLPSASTALPASMQVDYVRVFSSTLPEPAATGGLALLLIGSLLFRSERPAKSA